MEECLICRRIGMIEVHTNPYFVTELETGYVVMGDHQYFEGYTLFLCKEHKSELHELDEEFKQKFLVEMSKVAEAVYLAFTPDKLNYELLGNSDSHMHWHIFPRRSTEAYPNAPVWRTPKEIMYADNAKPSNDVLEQLKKRLIAELDGIL